MNTNRSNIPQYNFLNLFSISVLFILFVVCDLVTTYLFISSGHGTEYNPFFKTWAHGNGYFNMFIVKTVFLVIVYFYTKKINKINAVVYHVTLHIMSVLIIIQNLHVYLYGENVEIIFNFFTAIYSLVEMA